MLHANKEVGLEVNTEEAKYTFMFRHQNAGQNHKFKRGQQILKKKWQNSNVWEQQ
jgi:hypothetical protein